METFLHVYTEKRNQDILFNNFLEIKKKTISKDLECEIY